MPYDVSKMADWQIAEAAEENMPTPDEWREKLGLKKDEILAYGKVAKLDFLEDNGPAAEQAGRQVHRGNRRHPHPAGRRQDHHHHGPYRRPGQAERERRRLHPPAFGRPDHERQGHGGRRRQRPAHPPHRVFHGPYRRYQRHYERPQPGDGRPDRQDAARAQLR